MKKERLPVRIEPQKFAQARREISCQIDFDAMSRLQESGVKNAKILVEMAFAMDKEGLIVMDVQINGTLTLICQTTLKPFDFPIAIQSVLSPITHEREAERLPSDYEPILLHEDMIEPVHVVEDELLLHLPVVPRAPGERAIPHHNVSPAEEAKTNPFAVLKDLCKSD